MRLGKSAKQHIHDDGHRKRFMRQLPTVVRTSVDQHSSHAQTCEDDNDIDIENDTTTAPRSSYDPPAEARLTKPRPKVLRTAGYEYYLPASLRPAGTYTGRGAHALEDMDLGDDFGHQMRMIRARQDRIDSWINHLDSQISLARTEDVNLENVPLTHDMPPLTRAEHSRPRTWSGQEQLAVPVKSVHGSILMASNASSGGLSPWARSGSIPIGMIEQGAGFVMTEGPWTWREVLIVGLLCLTQAVHMYPYGQALATAVSLSTSLLHDERSTRMILDDTAPTVVGLARWITASYPLTQGVFVLLGRRLGIVYGHKVILLIACVWWTACQLACAFPAGIAVLCVLRGLAGIGAAFTTPNAVALLRTTVPPGRKKALVTSLFEAMTPIGAGSACLISGLLVQLTEWKWSFVVPACYGSVIFSLVWFVVPRDRASDHRGSIDWIGGYLGVAGLVVFNFVWNQAPVVGWSTPYIYILLMAAIGHLISFGFWEAKIAKKPLLPAGVWKKRHFPRTLWIASCSFMAVGIFLWYFSLFALQIRQQTFIANGANFQPMTVLAAAVVVAAMPWTLRIPAKYVFAGANVALVIGIALLATAPRDLTYWALLFPAMCFASISVAFALPAGQMLVRDSSKEEEEEEEEQSIAGGLIRTMVGYGLSTGIGIAATVEMEASDQGRNLLAGSRSALVLAMALAGTAVVGSIMFLGSSSRSRCRRKEKKGQKECSQLIKDRKGKGRETDSPVVDLDADRSYPPL